MKIYALNLDLNPQSDVAAINYPACLSLIEMISVPNLWNVFYAGSKENVRNFVLNLYISYSTNILFVLTNEKRKIIFSLLIMLINIYNVPTKISNKEIRININ